MALSDDLISQFVKATRDKEETKTETTAYGKIVKQGDVEYVQLDGSGLLTPISSTTVVQDGDRVMVTIKNHQAIVTGDLTTPAASDKQVQEIGTKISEFEIIIADKVSVKQLEAEVARIDKLITDDITATNAKFESLDAKVAEIDTIKADIVEVNGKITANEADITTIRGDIADFKDVTAEDIDAINGNFNTLNSDYADFKVTTTNKLSANEASIKELDTNKLDAKQAEIIYANIDFSNIGEAAIEKLFSDSGIIKDLIMSDGKVTGELVGVTIKGDLIEGNTVKADKLVILGTDGLYYKLNVNSLGETTAKSDPKYQNGLDGSNIIAKSITADRVAVTDLVAFGATIGGYHINDHALYSGVKSSVDNTTSGVFLGDDGQIAVGNANNYLKYYVDENGQYKLEIRASEIKFGINGESVEEAFDNIQVGGRNLCRGTRNFVIDPDRVKGFSTNVDKLTPIIDSDNFGRINLSATGLTSISIKSVYSSFVDFSLVRDKEVVISFDFMVDDVDSWDHKYPFILEYYDSSNARVAYNDIPMTDSRFNINTLESGKWYKLVYKRTLNSSITWSTGKTIDDVTHMGIRLSLFKNGSVHYKKLKVELGNIDTDWTPAPEDMATGEEVLNAQTTADSAKTIADETGSRLITAETLIQSLSDSISMLVRDKDGASLMTQTSEGWVFSTESIQNAIESTSNDLNNLQSTVGSVNNTVNILQQTVNDLGILSDYIKIKSYEDEPCIELGEYDSDYKVLITNTRILFQEGSSTPVRISGQALLAKRVIIEGSLEQGTEEEGKYIWGKRPNGNYGLTYQEGSVR